MGGATGQGVLLVAGKRCGGATGQGVLLVAGKRCGGATGQGVSLVTGKRCGGCHWAGGVAGRRQEVWGVPLGRGCHGLEVLLVAGKRCGGCHLAGGAMGWRCCWSQARGVVGATGQGVPWAGGAAGRRQEVWWVPLGRGCHGLEVLLVAGKRSGGCHWAGGVAVCLHVAQPFPHLFMLDALATLKEGCVCSCQDVTNLLMPRQPRVFASSSVSTLSCYERARSFGSTCGHTRQLRAKSWPRRRLWLWPRATLRK